MEILSVGVGGDQALPLWNFWKSPKEKEKAVLTHRVKIVEESNTVRRGSLDGELQEGFHVQMGLDHCRGPQKCGDCPRPVDTSCIT